MVSGLGGIVGVLPSTGGYSGGLQGDAPPSFLHCKK